MNGKVLTGLHSGAVTVFVKPHAPLTVKVTLVPSGMLVMIILPWAVVDGLSPPIVPALTDKLYEPVFPPVKGIVAV